MEPRIAWDDLPDPLKQAHIDLFAAANVRLWDEIVQSNKSAWTKDMARAAHAWAAHRQTR